MSSFIKLVNKATEHGCRIQLRYDPEERGEEWGIKYYPDSNDDAHYYAYSRDLESTSMQLLEELTGAFKW
jgi:hypothetical protein